jgi:hypothetical protein
MICIINYVCQKVEQRDWGLTFARQALGTHPLGAAIDARWAELSPPYAPPAIAGWTPVKNDGQTLVCGNTQFALDPATGAFTTLSTVGASGVRVAWASPLAPLGWLEYQQHSTAQYYDFFAEYGQDCCPYPPWFPKDFGKPGAYNTSMMAHNSSTPVTVTGAWANLTANGDEACQVVVRSTLPTDLQQTYLHIPSVTLITLITLLRYGAFSEAYTSLRVSDGGEPGTAVQVHVEILLLNKTATRLPESVWYRFRPPPGPASYRTADKLSLKVSGNRNSTNSIYTSSHNWTANAGKWHVEKLAEEVDTLDVCVNGSRHLHGVDHGVWFERPDGHILQLLTEDAAVVSFGPASPFPTPTSLPQASDGASFCLANNVWGTNYVMWYPFVPAEADLKFRFKLVLK